MRMKRCWLIVTALALVPACADDKQEDVTNDAAADVAAAKDAIAPDTVPDLADTQAAPDRTRDLGAKDASAEDLPTVETGRGDQGSAAETGGLDLPAVPDLALAAEVQGGDGKADTPSTDAASDTAGEAGPEPSYVCRDDSDCCVKVDHCMAKVYLYSKAPGASPAPTIPTVSDPGQCLRCITPGVQVRCSLGQCVGQSVSGSSSLAQDHCGTASLDGGSSSASPDEPAYAGGQQTVWGC